VPIIRPRRRDPGGTLTYSTNPNVIHETIDGETIIIDLASGTYFSLQGSGPRIWEALVAGEPVPSIVGRFAAAGDADAVESAVAAFLEQLEQEGLVARPAAAPAALVERTSVPSNGDGANFAPPVLEKYTDMQDIILPDPVHQVDARGWPHAQAETA
jgi:hypothetical protein